MTTEKRPSSDVNFAQPSTDVLGGGVVGVDVLGGSFGGRLVCSCAFIVELSPSVISKTTKRLFIFFRHPFVARKFKPADYNPPMHADDTDLKAL